MVRSRPSRITTPLLNLPGNIVKLEKAYDLRDMSFAITTVAFYGMGPSDYQQHSAKKMLSP